MSLGEGLNINPEFRQFIEQEVLPQTSLDVSKFWGDVESLLNEFMPVNSALLAKRERIQEQIDEWHRNNDYSNVPMSEYKQFLVDIGYLIPEGEDFSIETENVDDEVATIAAPQLVVPLKNARFALNAVNARWGSLYDAFYGTDAIPQTGKLKPNKKHNRLRIDEVIRVSRNILDRTFPLESGSHHDVTLYQVYYQQLTAVLKDGTYIGLKFPKQFVAYNGPKSDPTEIVLKNNGLHVEIRIAPNSEVGRLDLAGIGDIRMESAVTTIMDCEDSVAAVDSEDKIEVYRNWLGLMRGDLSQQVVKNGKASLREMKKDRLYTSKDGESYKIRRRSLMFIRNVGHLMTLDTIKDKQGNDIPEGILDGIFTVMIGAIDLQKNKNGKVFNSKSNSIYVVKPKMHGPEEVKFACDLMTRIEEMVGLPKNTVKIGIMDEERRTTVNLKECIRMAKERCVFINTGFLDRTGDEFRTSMESGPFLPKHRIPGQPWITAYENWNVDVGLLCGLQGKAQIGKGMWAKPEAMAEMRKEKISHPLAGANTAWVPSPTAATLHALHYHQVDVFAEQNRIKTRNRASLDDLLTLPLLTETLSEEVIQREIDNNVQGLLGYVVRWIRHGIGCSKVPDINNVDLMEDRATLRISSQHISNWLHHGLCSEEQVIASMKKMAVIVDQQNAEDPSYVRMSDDFDNDIAFKASVELIFNKDMRPNGYTEPLLHKYRRELKEQ